MAISVAGGADGVRAVRRWWRTASPPPSLGRRLEPVYLVGVTAAILGPFAYGTASSALSQITTPRVVASWGPALALVCLWAVARWGAVQGPAVFSAADVAHLLGAPLPRRAIVRRRLWRGLLAGAAVGALAAAILIVGVAGQGRGISAARAAGLVAGTALLGVLGVALASAVQGSATVDRVTRLATWPVLLVAAGLVAVGAGDAGGRAVERWTGPWGWAIAPVSGAEWPVALGLLAVVAAAAAARALARCGDCPTERHAVRAQARSGAIASLYSFDARTARQSLRAASAGRGGRTAWRARRPRRPGLATAWRDATVALGHPQRLAEAALLAAGGALVALLDASHPAAVVGGAFVVYLGASRLLEPLRAETDAPGRAWVLLTRPLGRILVEHALVPAVVVTAAAAVAAAGCAIAGALPTHGGAAALALVAATPAITLCAALNSRRGGRLPSSMMSALWDPSGAGGGLLFAWLVVWPVLGTGIGSAAVIAVVDRGPSAIPTVLALLAASPVALTAGLSWERFAP